MKGDPPRIMFPPNGARLEARRQSGGRPAAEIHRRAGAAHRHGQRHAAAPGPRTPHPVLPARRAGFRPADRHGRARRRGQRHRPIAVGAVTARSLLGLCPARHTGRQSFPTDEHDHQRRRCPGFAGPWAGGGAGLGDRLASARAWRCCIGFARARLPAGLLPDPAGRPRRGALRAGHQADAGEPATTSTSVSRTRSATRSRSASTGCRRRR